MPESTHLPISLSPSGVLDRDFAHSVLRERIVEHLFVGEALRLLWRRGITDVEVLRSEFDAGGYDLVMSRGKVVRHIQFKTTTVGGKAASVSIGLKLAEKPGGCVIWTLVTPGLELQSFRWFGGAPGEPLPDIAGMKITKHTKANAQGIKTEKPQHRVVPVKAFTALPTLDKVLEALFGPLP